MQIIAKFRFMYLMDNEKPSYRTFGKFINNVLSDSIEDIFNDINKKIFDEEKIDLNHLYIDGSKFEANANKYSWVWKKATGKSRYRYLIWNDMDYIWIYIQNILTFNG